MSQRNLASSKSEIFQNTSFSKDMKTNSELNLDNNENMASMFKTRATGINPDSGINMNSNYSPEIDEGEKSSNYRSNWIRKSNTKTLASEL